MVESCPVRFFFGANTPTGFYGYHASDLYDPRGGWRAFLIKSGAGTGKATLMRAVWAQMQEEGFEGEAIVCSSDPDSLDAIVFREVKLCVVDATAPHILEPTAYGECEQLVPLGCCLDADTLEAHSGEWYAHADACAAAHARCCRFLAAAAGLLDNNAHLQRAAMNEPKAIAAARRLAQKEFGGRRTARGRETRRFLSAVTPQGHLVEWETATALCPRLFVLEDEGGSVAATLLSVLREEALAAGLDIYTCACPLAPHSRLEHLLVPSLGVGFLTSHSRHTVDFPVYRRIHAARFLDGGTLKAKKQQMAFDRRAAREMLHAAVEASADAKRHHDEMERLHTAAMDWTLWQQICDHTAQACLQTAKGRRG